MVSHSALQAWLLVLASHVWIHFVFLPIDNPAILEVEDIQVLLDGEGTVIVRHCLALVQQLVYAILQILETVFTNEYFGISVESLAE